MLTMMVAFLWGMWQRRVDFMSLFTLSILFRALKPGGLFLFGCSPKKEAKKAAADVSGLKIIRLT